MKRSVALGQNRLQRGFSMVEVMVSVVVLSVGLLGMAALQARSLQENRGAYLRSQGSILAYDILERIRANSDAAIAGKYDMSMGTRKFSTGNSMADTDLKDWVANLTSLLPSGDGSVDCDSNGNCTVIVQWFDNSVTEDVNEDGVVDDKDKVTSITLASTL
ncbi:type IV pilus modification protein PilV [Parathalassolituus penaei]|uniref:Type IV pilus modification protein PilV n=1 Tax=Parathalassolituus penaei TaxID=2997323 RepID=A0A9X3EE51_9GAMM|nr:type IV pilus modification protein PilV [Parathalassolituus penaei]MCY0965535.1 type IV pilus modification protein PilV [Parathalassolituus penaei]